MASGDVTTINSDQTTQILEIEEGQFHDLKRIEIAPGALTKTLSAFANSDGGEVYVGIGENKADRSRFWSGFENIEAANGHMQAIQECFPLGEDLSFSFLRTASAKGLVLKLEVFKTRHIVMATNRMAYYRFNAQNLPADKPEIRERLERNKGIVSFETSLLNVDSEMITESDVIKDFMKQVVPTAKARDWLKKQQLLRGDKPTVAGALIFADEPQALIPKRCGIKIYRYKTRDAEGSRATLGFDPISIEGCAYQQIYAAVRKTVEVIEASQKVTDSGLENIHYPPETIHEIIANAVLHRDYAILDDVHIRVFDNRVEVESPGSLPGHVTIKNILSERYARNGAVVRIINKFPNPPNKDVGEGLNTAFEAMKDLKLRPPLIVQKQNSVLVNIRHETLASPEEAILDYLTVNKQIANRQARDLCAIGSENSMKAILQKMVKSGLIEVVPGLKGVRTAYQLKTPGDSKSKRGRPSKK